MKTFFTFGSNPCVTYFSSSPSRQRALFRPSRSGSTGKPLSMNQLAARALMALVALTACALVLLASAATASAADYSALDSAYQGSAYRGSVVREPAKPAFKANLDMRELSDAAQAARASRVQQDTVASNTDFSQDSRFAPPSATSDSNSPSAVGSDTISRFADSCAELSGVIKDLKNEVAGLRSDRKAGSPGEVGGSRDAQASESRKDMAGPPSPPGLVKAKFTSWLKLHDNGYKPGQVVCISVNRTEAQNLKQQEICNLRGYTFVVHDHPQDPDVPEGLSWHRADDDGILYPWNSPHWSNVATSTTKIPRIKQAPPILQQWFPVPPAVRYEPLYMGGGCADGSCSSGACFGGGCSSGACGGGSCSMGGCSGGSCGSGGFFGGGGCASGMCGS